MIAGRRGALDARQRLCLTSTPMENHLGELWSLFDIILPGFLDSERDFNRTFRIPIEKYDDIVCRTALVQRIQPFLLRRTKTEVAIELPPKTEILQSIELGEAQRDLYETIHVSIHDNEQLEIATEGLARSRLTILDALLKLRQVCCDPRLLRGNGEISAGRSLSPSSAKLAVLATMLPQLVAAWTAGAGLLTICHHACADRTQTGPAHPAVRYPHGAHP